MASDKYLLVAAIDFGTTYSGYAFSTRHDYLSDPMKMSLVQWTAGTGGLLSMKASTCVLFKPDRSFHSFGYEAEDKYLELTLDKEHEGWYLFRRFKMNLYNAKLDRDVRLTDFSGKKKMPAIDVISATIAYLKSHLMKKCKEQGVDVDDSDIRWVLTVPAIWTDPAKQMMREAAEKCPLLTDAIQRIACGTRLIVPNEAGLAVLKGAVITGHCPSTISERICKYTYGVEAHLPFIKGKHKKEHRVVGDGGKKLCKLAFDSFVKKGTAVKIDEHSKAKTYTPLLASQTSMYFSIYASTEEEPLYVMDTTCQKIGKIKVELPDTTRGLKRSVCVTMCFGGSEIEIKAVDEDTGRSVRAVCDFLG